MKQNGGFGQSPALQAAINRFLEEHNQKYRPTWTADPDEIIAAVRRGHQVLELINALCGGLPESAFDQ